MRMDDVAFTMKIAFINRATLDSENQRWTPLRLGTRSIVWAAKRFRGIIKKTKFRVSTGHKAQESIDIVGNLNCMSPAVFWSSVPRSIAHSSTAKAAPTASPSVSLTRACYGVRPQWLDKPQHLGIHKP